MGLRKAKKCLPSNSLENETYTSFSKTNRPDSGEVCVTPCAVTEQQNAACFRSATPLAAKHPFTSFQSPSSSFDTFPDQPGYNLQQASSFYRQQNGDTSPENWKSSTTGARRTTAA